MSADQPSRNSAHTAPGASSAEPSTHEKQGPYYSDGSNEQPQNTGPMSHHPDPAQHGGAPEAAYQHPTKSDAAATSSEKQPQTNGNTSAQNTTQDKTQPQQQEHKGPPGGYDATPVPHREPGYDVRITFNRATKLPIADLPTLSSDPYIHAELTTDLPVRHKEDPKLRFRTRTLFSTTDPEWNESWTIANIPASGFKLKARIYDEDRGDADDRLGNVHIEVGRIDERWEGIVNQPYKVKKRMGSKRAYLLRAVAVCFRLAEEMSGHLYVSVEVLGRSTSSGGEGGRAYTLGLQYWCKHYAPILGRIVGAKTKDDSEDEDEDGDAEKKGDGTPQTPGSAIPGAALLTKKKKRDSKSNVSKYNFQANQMQLQGPVPPELYHRYVEFKPFIKSLFTASGIRGILLQKVLHHQHAQIYNFDRQTKYGVFKGPCQAMTQRFLDLVHHDDGGRMFTYVLTLDGLMRFTETGKEFGIDMLSKHTMHSDASIYIAYSGEFFIRRRQDHHRKKASDHDESQLQSKSTMTQPAAPSKTDADEISKTSDPTFSPSNPSTSTKPSKPTDLYIDTNNHTEAAEPAENPQSSDSRPTQKRTNSAGSPHNPKDYELIIDNDSGTYRPNAALLPLLQSFLSTNFPGLRVITLDCQSDAELMNRLKTEQREKKKRAQEASGGRVVYTQASASSSESSIESSDVERLDSQAEEGMVEDTRRREDYSGTGQGRDEGRIPSAGGMHDSKVPPPRERSTEPKHRLGGMALPYLHNQRARDFLTREGGHGHDGAAEREGVSGQEASGSKDSRPRESDAKPGSSGSDVVQGRYTGAGAYTTPPRRRSSASSASGEKRQRVWEEVEARGKNEK